MATKQSLKIKVIGISDKECGSAVDAAINKLVDALPEQAISLLAGTKVTIGSNLISSGAKTNAEKKEIILDKDKNKLSLQQADDFLVSAGVLNKGDWAKALGDQKHKPWSCLTYQLVHEFGHIIDGLSTGEPYNRLNVKHSPTKYGSISSTESFADAFAYWVFGLPIDVKAMQAIKQIIA